MLFYFIFPVIIVMRTHTQNMNPKGQVYNLHDVSTFFMN